MPLRFFKFIKRGTTTFLRRVRTYGLRPALTLLYGQGPAVLTGIPALNYSRVTPQLYVGPQYRQAGKRALEKSGIHGSVNLRIEFDDAAHGLALTRYCYLPVVDGEAPSLAQLNEGIAFIRQVVAEGGKVYIHCRGGVGRAPTLATAYLISQGFAAPQAIELIRQARPFIEIKPPQIEQLKRFEANERHP